MDIDANFQPFIHEIEKIKDMLRILFRSTLEPSFNFIITNLKERNNPYCLVIQQKIIKLAWKNQQTKSMIVFDIEQGEFFLDGKRQNFSLLHDFQLKIAHILNDLKSNQATVYKG